MAFRRIHFFSLAQPGLVDDIVESYRLAAEELGHQTSFSRDTIVPGMLNILFFSWRVTWDAISGLHPQCIVVNFEHLSDGATWFLPSYREVLKKCYLWEYSETNFHRHRELEFLAADYVPLGYQHGAGPELAWDDALPESERDIDVLFFGALNPRRTKVLQALIGKGLRVHTPAEHIWTVEERDACLRRTKVALNFHQFDDSRIVETPRLNILFRNRKAVVCELYPDSELTPLWRDAVVGVPYDDLVDATLALLGNPARRAELEAMGYQRFTGMAQKPVFAAALARFDQWLEQQCAIWRANDLGDESARATVVLTLDDGAEGLALTTASLLLQQQHAAMDVLAITRGAMLPGTAMQATSALSRRQCLELPARTDRAASRNLGLAKAQGSYIAFIEAGDTAVPDRLQRQVAFLDAHPSIDIVGSWLGHTGLWTSLHKTPELDHEIKAEFLESQGGLMLRTCMFRTRFLQRTGLRFDAQFDAHNDAHFLYRCSAANARFAVIPVALCERHVFAGSPSESTSRNVERLVTHARRELLEVYFPHLTGNEVERLCELYSTQWPGDLRFASELLDLMAKASESPAEALNLVPATVRRTLRHEAVRLLKIFSGITLNDPDWLASQFTSLSKARLLAPARGELPTLQ